MKGENVPKKDVVLTQCRGLHADWRDSGEAGSESVHVVDRFRDGELTCHHSSLVPHGVRCSG